MIKAVLFDLDDTLLDRDATAGAFLHEQFVRLVAPVSGADAESFVDLVLQYQAHGYGDKRAAYRRTCEELGITGIQPEELLEDFNRNYGGTPVLLPGAHETLRVLKEKYVLGIITNSRTAWQNAKLNASGLREYFKEILISESAGATKPDPFIFKKCMDKLGLGPDECVYVGDHPEKDIQGAHGAGMRAVWVKNAFYPAPKDPDGTIEHLSELPDVIAAL